MASTVGTSYQGRTIYVENVVVGGGAALSTTTPTTTTTAKMSSVVPGDGAEVVEATFTVTTAGAGGGSQAFSVGDGTNALFTMAATINTTVANTVVACALADVANGRAIATTKGKELILSNTAAGTQSTALSGIFRVVWAL